MDPVDAEIEQIRKEIKDLRLKTVSKLTSLDSKIRLLKEARRAEVTPVQTAQRHYTGHDDKFGTRIYVGDKVVFLTKGRYDSEEGIVSGYTKDRVLATDYKNREIPRAAHNVRVE